MLRGEVRGCVIKDVQVEPKVLGDFTCRGRVLGPPMRFMLICGAHRFDCVDFIYALMLGAPSRQAFLGQEGALLNEGLAVMLVYLVLMR